MTDIRESKTSSKYQADTADMDRQEGNFDHFKDSESREMNIDRQATKRDSHSDLMVLFHFYERKA